MTMSHYDRTDALVKAHAALGEFVAAGNITNSDYSELREARRVIADFALRAARAAVQEGLAETPTPGLIDRLRAWWSI